MSGASICRYANRHLCPARTPGTTPGDGCAPRTLAFQRAFRKPSERCLENLLDLHVSSRPATAIAANKLTSFRQPENIFIGAITAATQWEWLPFNYRGD